MTDQIQNSFTKQSLPSFSCLLKQSLLLYFSNLVQILGILIVPSILSIYISYITHSLSFLSLVILSIFMILILYISQIALIYFISQESQNILDSYEKSLSILLPFLYVVILNALVSLGAYILFIIPGLIVSVYLSLYPFIIVKENKKGMSVLVQSWYYVKNYWISVFWRAFLFFIFFLITIFLLAVILNLIFSGKVLIQTILRATILLFFYPLSVIFLYLIYSSLKEIKKEAISEFQENKIKNYLLIFIIVYFVILFIAFISTIFK